MPGNCILGWRFWFLLLAVQYTILKLVTGIVLVDRLINQSIKEMTHDQSVSMSQNADTRIPKRLLIPEG